MNDLARSALRLRGVTLAALALPSLFWAGNFIIARAARGEVPPLALSFGRWAIAFLCLLPFALPHLRRDRDWYLAHPLPVVFCGLTGVTLFNTLVYIGVQYTTATNGMLLNSTIPVLILLFGALFFRRRLRPLQGLGLLVSTLGVAVVLLHGDPSRLTALDVSKGDLVIFLAMVCWALYTLVLSRIPATVNRTGLLTVQIAMTLLILLPFVLWEAASRQPSFSPAAIGALLYVGIVPSVMATLLYMKAVSLAGPALAGQSIHLIPVYGAALSSLFLGETLHLYHAVGFGAIIAGIVIASRAARG